MKGRGSASKATTATFAPAGTTTCEPGGWRRSSTTSSTIGARVSKRKRTGARSRVVSLPLGRARMAIAFSSWIAGPFGRARSNTTSVPSEATAFVASPMRIAVTKRASVGGSSRTETATFSAEPRKTSGSWGRGLVAWAPRFRIGSLSRSAVAAAMTTRLSTVVCCRGVSARRWSVAASARAARGSDFSARTSIRRELPWASTRRSAESVMSTIRTIVAPIAASVLASMMPLLFPSPPSIPDGASRFVSARTARCRPGPVRLVAGTRRGQRSQTTRIPTSAMPSTPPVGAERVSVSLAPYFA